MFAVNIISIHASIYNTLLTLLLRSLTIIVGLSFSENCNTRDTVGDQGSQGNGNTRDADCGGQEPSQIHVDKFISK